MSLPTENTKVGRSGTLQTFHNRGLLIRAKGCDPVKTRRGLPGDPKDEQARYIEAAVNGVVVGCLYLPNGNPEPGPKFEYKMQWLARLNAYAAELLASKEPVALVGDYNVIPTDFDVYKPESWRDDALMHPDAQKAFHELVAQGWTDAVRKLHPKERVYTFRDYWRNAWARDAGLRIDHFLLSPSLATRLKSAKVDRGARGREGASDHAPVWIELADKRAPARTSSPAKRAGAKTSPGKKATTRRSAAKRKPTFR
jgi:exodeoxyribonuclease-3